MPAQIVSELVNLIRYKVDGQDGLKRSQREAERGAQRVERAGARIGTGFEVGAARGRAALVGIASAARRVLVTLGGAFTIGRVLSITGEMAQLDTQLRQVTRSAGEFDEIQRRLFETSQAYPRAIAENTESFIRFRQALPAATTQQQLDLFEALQASMAASGTSASRASQLMRRFTRGLAEGALGTSTIQTFLDGDVRGLRALIRGLNLVDPAFGATTENIRQLAADGKLTADVVMRALLSQLSNLRKEAVAAPDSLQDAMTKLQNAVRKMIDDSSSTRGALGLVTRAISFLARHIKTVTALVIAFGAVWAASKVPAIIMGIVEAVRILRTAIVAMNAAAWANPYILIGAAIVATLALIALAANDIYTYLTGGDSIMGRFIERSRSWTGWMGAARDAIRDAWHILRDVGRLIGAIATGNITNIVDAFNNLSDSVIDFVGGLFGISDASGKVNHATKVAVDAIKRAWGSLGDVWDKVADGLKSAFRGALDWVEGKMRGVIKLLNKLPGVNIGSDDLGVMSGFSSSAPVTPSVFSTHGDTNSGNTVTINQTVNGGNPAGVQRATQAGVRRVFVGQGMPSVEVAQ